VKKILVVLAVLTLGTLASAQTFSFWNSAGTEQYCNFNVITYNSGGVVAGYDDTTAACYFAYNSPIVGFDATVPNAGPSAYGKGVVVGDAIYDASADMFTGEQWTVFQKLTYSKQNKKSGKFQGAYGWEGVAGTLYGSYYGDNYGYLGAVIPGKTQGAGHGTTAGKSHSAVKK
jgi:hypothetical protein